MADRFDDRRIRSGLAVLVDEAPLAPEFDELTTTRVRPIEQRRTRPLVTAGLTAAGVLSVFIVGAIWTNQGGGNSSDLAAESPGTPSEAAPITPSTAISTPTTLADLASGKFPRVLPAGGNWAVSYLDHTEGTTAEGTYATSDVQFSNESDEVELRMASGWHADLEALTADRLATAARLGDAPIWDTTAVLATTGGKFIAVWESNSVEYELVDYETDEASFRELVASLTQMPEAEWITALSDDIVVDRSEAVSDYLSDIPMPPGFDGSSLGDGPIEHWYQVAAETVSAVSCAWIESWIDGKTTGDSQAVQAALNAMGSSSDWHVLSDMDAIGDYPSVVWEYADAMAGGGTVAAGGSATVEDSYQRAFGCTS